MTEKVSTGPTAGTGDFGPDLSEVFGPNQADGGPELVQLLTPEGERVICHPRGKKSDCVVGDMVRWQPAGDEGVIEHIEPRRNLLHRQDEWKSKSFAANIDQVLVLVAGEPMFSESQLARALIVRGLFGLHLGVGGRIRHGTCRCDSKANQEEGPRPCPGHSQGSMLSVRGRSVGFLPLGLPPGPGPVGSRRQGPQVGDLAPGAGYAPSVPLVRRLHGVGGVNNDTDRSLDYQAVRGVAHDRRIPAFRAIGFQRDQPRELVIAFLKNLCGALHPGGAPNCADWIMQEAYSHELSSVGFWPGTGLEPAEAAALLAHVGEQARVEAAERVDLERHLALVGDEALRTTVGGYRLHAVVDATVVAPDLPRA